MSANVCPRCRSFLMPFGVEKCSCSITIDGFDRFAITHNGKEVMIRAVNTPLNVPDRVLAVELNRHEDTVRKPRTWVRKRAKQERRKRERAFVEELESEYRELMRA